MNTDTLTAMEDLGTDTPIDEAPKPAPRWSRLWKDPLTLALAIATVVLAGGVIALAAVAADNYNTAVAAQDQRDEYASQIENLESENDALALEVEKYEPFYDLASELDGREAIVSEREAAHKTETDATAAALAEREAAVKAREDLAASNSDTGEWWISRVRECLSRQGSDRMASVSEGSLVGRDVTCVTM